MLIVFSILDKVYFKRFLESGLYKKYTDEVCINSAYLSAKIDNGANENGSTKTSKELDIRPIDASLYSSPLWLPSAHRLGSHITQYVGCDMIHK